MTAFPALLESGSEAVAVGAAPLGPKTQHCLSITVIANDGNSDDIFVENVLFLVGQLLEADECVFQCIVVQRVN